MVSYVLREWSIFNQKEYEANRSSADDSVSVGKIQTHTDTEQAKKTVGQESYYKDDNQKPNLLMVGWGLMIINWDVLTPLSDHKANTSQFPTALMSQTIFQLH